MLERHENRPPLPPSRPIGGWRFPPMEKGGEKVPILNSTGNDMCMYTSKPPGELRRFLKLADALPDGSRASDVKTGCHLHQNPIDGAPRTTSGGPGRRPTIPRERAARRPPRRPARLGSALPAKRVHVRTQRMRRLQRHIPTPAPDEYARPRGDLRARRPLNGTGHTGPSEFCATSI